MNNHLKQLQNLRGNIDDIDDSILGLIMDRTDISLEIAKIKNNPEHSENYPTAWRPAREMTILRRLMAKHKGFFPKTSIFRIWREIFGALVNLQKPFTMAVFMPKRGAGFLEIARDQFGAYSAFTVCGSIGQVIREVSENKASVGIIPIDDEYDTESPWWVKMLPNNEKMPKVVARLPLIGPGEGRGDGKEAYVLAAIPNEKTDDDRSLLVVEVLEMALSISALKEKLEKVDIQIEKICANYTIDDKQCAYLAEIHGHIKEDDERIKKLYENEQKNISRITIIGGYAVPLNIQS